MKPNISASPAIIKNQQQNQMIFVPMSSGYNQNIQTRYNHNQQMVSYSIVSGPDNHQEKQTELPSYKQ